ncbi:hypothetical protein Pla175_20350 [Pirellulimonas nuda]|uniref:Uncharacterized protein n=1 Tax=Pirellulimonas nuda TaxID=2528009 RepID=A0A518DAZ8_9BACT|nr:hypothetical protein Pla175_20350 [Pirellulimonas nuda]
MDKTVKTSITLPQGAAGYNKENVQIGQIREFCGVPHYGRLGLPNYSRSKSFAAAAVDWRLPRSKHPRCSNS